MLYPNEALADGNEHWEITGAPVGHPAWAIGHYVAEEGRIPELPDGELIHLTHPRDSRLFGSVRRITQVRRDEDGVERIEHVVEPLPADPTRFAQVLGYRYEGRVVLDAQALDSTTTLGQLKAVAGVPSDTVATSRDAVESKLWDLGHNASALIAEVSFTEWRDGYQTQLYLLLNDDDEIYVQLESGERLELSEAGPLFEKMLRGPGGVFQTHAIIYDSEGNLVEGQRFTITNPADGTSSSSRNSETRDEPSRETQQRDSGHRSLAEQAAATARGLAEYERSAGEHHLRPQPSGDLSENASAADISQWVGGHAEHFGRGAAGRDRLAQRLLGGAPGRPATEEQRLGNHRRRAFVIDGGRVYAVVNHLGELAMVEMGRLTGAFDVESGEADIHAIEYSPDGVLVHPVDPAAAETPRATAQFGGVEPDMAARMARFARRLDEEYARLEAARRDGESSAVEAAAADYRRLGRIVAGHTSAVVRLVSYAERVRSLAVDSGLDVSPIESLDDRIAKRRLASPRPDRQTERSLQSLEVSVAEYRQARLEVRRAEIEAVMASGDPSDSVGGDAPEWPGGAPLGLAVADLDARAETNRITFTLNLALHARLGDAGVGSVAWVSERIDGEDVRYLLVATAGAYGPRIVRLDPITGDVSIVPLGEIRSAELSAAFFEPVRPQADFLRPELAEPRALPSADTVTELRDRRDTLAAELAARGVPVDLVTGESGTTGWRRAIWSARQRMWSALAALADPERQHPSLAGLSQRDRDQVGEPLTVLRQHYQASERLLVALDEVVCELADADDMLLADIRAQLLESREGYEKLTRMSPSPLTGVCC